MVGAVKLPEAIACLYVEPAAALRLVRQVAAQSAEIHVCIGCGFSLVDEIAFGPHDEECPLAALLRPTGLVVD